MENFEKNKIYQGNSLDVLKTFPGKSINCCVTSPPYWGLRDYGCEGQLGLEKTPEEYVNNLVLLFREVRRCLRDDGTLWLNLGDSYYNFRGYTDYATPQTISSNDAHKMESACGKRNTKQDGLKGKDLVGIPWMTAFALRSDGWYLRQDLIWHKPNPMPESVTDRCTKSHEYIFLLSKSQKYYFDHESIQEDSVTMEERPNAVVRDRLYGYDSKQSVLQKRNRPNGVSVEMAKQIGHIGNCGVNEKRNKRSVWTVNTKPYTEAHFATFPEKLIVDMVKAGCPEGGLILDPFMGAGTTGLVARKLGRDYVGIELNPKYINIAEKRIFNEIGLFL